MNDHGNFYAIGSNGNGQLGIGSQDDCARPALAKFANSLCHSYPVRIAGGGNHSMILSSDGTLWSTPRDATLSGTSGQDSGRFIFHPVIASHFPNTQYKLCSATWSASFLVTKDNQIQVFGTGEKGALGLGLDEVESLDFQTIKGFPPEGIDIIDIASSMGHTAVVLSDGSIYGWGNGRKEQLGRPGIFWTPRKIDEIDFEATRVVCGREFTLVVGHSDLGQFKILGIDKHQIKSSCPSSLLGWTDVQASWGSAYVLLKDGSLVSWGRNDHGQLPPSGIPYLRSMAAGSEHVIAVTDHGQIISWGWGEHGNCGEPIDADGDVKGRWNSLDLNGVASKAENIIVGAGCATSWIWRAH